MSLERKTIAVTFTQTTQQQGSTAEGHPVGVETVNEFSFDPHPLELDPGFTEYEVTFTITSNVEGTRLIADHFHGQPQPVQLNAINGDQGSRIITFENPNLSTPQVYHYDVSVELPGNVIIQSPDPEIIIPPG